MANIVQRLVNVWRARNAAVTSPHQLMQLLLGRSYATDSGANVNPETALRTSTVYACVKLLSEDIAKLPLHLYERIDRGKRRVTDHWLVALLDNPNPWQTGFEFREMQQLHTEMIGEFMALKTVVRGEVRELLPLSPHRILEVKQLPNYKLVYKVMMPNNALMDVPQEAMYHVRGLSVDGIRGVSPIDYQREAIGLNIQLTKYGSKLYKNGALLGGMLEHPGPAAMSLEAYNRLKDSFEENYAGIDNAHKTILLEEGTKYNAVAMKAQEAQFLESRKFSRTEIAAIYRVPPHMIGDLERATFSNIEHQSLEYVQNALLPRMTRLEARMAMILMTPEMRKTLYFKHQVNALLRGSYDQRMAGYVNGINNSILTPNEAREFEDLNPGDPEMDKFRMPLNMQIVGEPPPVTKTPNETETKALVQKLLDHVFPPPPPPPVPPAMRKTIVRDATGNIASVIEEPLTLPKGPVS